MPKKSKVTIQLDIDAFKRKLQIESLPELEKSLEDLNYGITSLVAVQLGMNNDPDNWTDLDTDYDRLTHEIVLFMAAIKH